MPTPAPTGARPEPPRYDDDAGFRIIASGITSARESSTIAGPGRLFASAPTSRRGSSTRNLEDGKPSLLSDSAVPKPTLLQPRVAAVLGVPKLWQKALFVCRLLSIAPAIWWGLPNGIRFLMLLQQLVFDGDSTQIAARDEDNTLRLVETSLATIWCAAAAYLSFFFTDSLMSRWLVNYTPQASVVRLLTINALNAYLTSWVLYLSGGSEDAHLLLPAWIAIATTLTIVYHITQRKINIRKETRLSISVFSMASYTSMVVLLFHLQTGRSESANVPLRNITRKARYEAGRLALYVLGYGSGTTKEA